MKPSLRTRYLGWLMVFVIFCMMLTMSLDAMHDFLPAAWKAEGTPHEEAAEIAFIVIAHILLLPFILLLGWRVTRRMLKPIEAFAQAAHRISGGEFGTRILSEPADGPIHSLAQTLNTAFDRYDQALRQARRFSRNAAHQLRTPLTIMRNQSEIALRRERTPDEYREDLRATLVQTDRLQKTVEQLLALSRIESGEVRRNFERINLSYIAREAVETYGSVFQVKGIALAVTAPAEAPAMGSSLLIGQMVANLLDNAARLTPADGRVDVGIHPAANGGWLLDVADSGPGIPVQDRQTVFEAFSQGSHPDQRGTGLGLAIVAEIARVHAGSVSADASPSGGALIRVALPHVISAASP